MAIASPALALASAVAQTFNFTRRQSVKVQVRFYTDAEGTLAIAPDAGTRDVDVTITSSVYEPPSVQGGYSTPSLLSFIDGGSQLANKGGTWYEFELADGTHTVNVAASGGTDPGTANSYRILLDVELAV